MEEISPFALNSVSFKDSLLLPHIAGIYFIISESQEILYIGYSTDIWERWGHHHKRKLFSTLPSLTIAWLEIKDSNNLKKLEVELISHFKPIHNKCIEKCPYCGRQSHQTGRANSKGLSYRCTVCKKFFSKKGK